DESERGELLREWTGGRSSFPRELSVGELFEEKVRERGEAIAVRYGKEEVSYRELNERANRLAHALRARGVGAESVVGLLMERSVTMVVSMVAVAKSGGAYLPLDPSYPEERLRYMVEDAGASLVLTSEEELEVAGDSEENPEPVSNGGSLLYVMYTSGSTGQAKGVLVPHRAVTRLVRSTDYVSLGVEDVVAQASNGSFDAATFEVWGGLLNGARVEGFRREEILSGGELSRLLREREVTVLFLTTALFHQLSREERSVFGSLRTVLFGGEAVDAERVRELLRGEGPPRRLLHVYGPTENTTFSTWHEVREVEEGARTVAIGRAIANSEAYVLDVEMSAVPVGVAGELYVGGEGLSRGYLGRAELTASRFVPHPFSDRGGERLYRTGDRVVWNREGAIEFLGRFDHQVKIRGFRIEPGEIESALVRHAAVKECAVIARGEGSEEKYLAAYVVFEDDASLTSATLASDLRKVLPEYMVPSAIVLLPALPLTPNGKLDRDRLPVPRRRSSSDAPRTPVEEAVAAIWAEVLDVESVGVDDDFFDLGGHSLKATRVVSRIRKTFDVELPIRALFENPSVAGLARAIETRRGLESAGSVPSIAPAPRGRDLPLSFAQQRLWFLDQLGAGSAYNVPMAVRLTGPLDVEALASSLKAVEERHESLRTSFRSLGGEPMQVLSAKGALELGLTDLRPLAADGRETELRRLVLEEARKPFDLSQLPLLRASLIRVGDEEHVFLLTMHHIVSDGWSMGVLLREITDYYQGFARKRPVALPPLEIQYSDFAVWQRKWLSGEVLESQRAYWRRQLEDVPTLSLPTDRPRPPVQSFHGAGVPMRLSREATAAIRELCERHGVTAYMVLLAVLKVLLYRYTGEEDIAVGSPVANRNRAEIEGLIGFFVNSLVMRASLAGDPSFREVLRRVRNMALDAYAHQDLPFEKLVDELQPERDLG
ncbi:MAG: amino acid adenylation domain-containing protein, partial [Vicinamibacteria bacterium]